MVRDADRGCPPRASPLADQTRRLGRLGGRPGTFDSVCRRVVLDIRGRVRTGVGVGWCFDEARPHARHKRAYESEHLGPGAEPAKHNDSSVRAAFRLVNPVPTRGPAVASPSGSSDWEPSVFETRASPIRMCRKRPFATHGQRPLPVRAAVCRIPCLILCLANVWRVGQCHGDQARLGPGRTARNHSRCLAHQL